MATFNWDEVDSEVGGEDVAPVAAATPGGSMWDDIDSEIGASGAASQLAKRRWQKLTGQSVTGPKRDTLAPAIGTLPETKGNFTAKNAAALGASAIMGPVGAIRLGLGGPTGPGSTPADVEADVQHRADVTAGLGRADNTAQPFIDPYQEQVLQRPEYAGMVSGNTVTPQQQPDWVLRMMQNLPASANTFYGFTAAFPAMLARHPIDTAKGIVHLVGGAYSAVGRGAAYEYIKATMPTMEPVLRKHGITSDDLKNAAGDDVMALIAGLAGGVEAAKLAHKGATYKPQSVEVQPGDYNMGGDVRATTAEAAKAKRGADTRAAVEKRVNESKQARAESEAVQAMQAFKAKLKAQQYERTPETDIRDARLADRARIIAGPVPYESPIVEGTPTPSSPPILQGPKGAKPLIEVPPTVSGVKYDPATGLPPVEPREVSLATEGPSAPFNNPENLRRGTMGPPQGAVRGVQELNNPPSPLLYGPDGGPIGGTPGKGGVTLGTGLGGLQNLFDKGERPNIPLENASPMMLRAYADMNRLINERHSLSGTSKTPERMAEYAKKIEAAMAKYDAATRAYAKSNPEAIDPNALYIDTKKLRQQVEKLGIEPELYQHLHLGKPATVTSENVGSSNWLQPENYPPHLQEMTARENTLRKERRALYDTNRANPTVEGKQRFEQLDAEIKQVSNAVMTERVRYGQEHPELLGADKKSKGTVLGTGLGGLQDLIEGKSKRKVGGVEFTYAGELKDHKGQVKERYWKADRELPFTGGGLNSRITETALGNNGFDMSDPAVRDVAMGHGRQVRETTQVADLERRRGENAKLRTLLDSLNKRLNPDEMAEVRNMAAEGRIPDHALSNAALKERRAMQRGEPVKEPATKPVDRSTGERRMYEPVSTPEQRASYRSISPTEDIIAEAQARTRERMAMQRAQMATEAGDAASIATDIAANSDNMDMAAQAAEHVESATAERQAIEQSLADSTPVNIENNLKAAQGRLQATIRNIGKTAQSGGLGDLPGVTAAMFEVAYWQARKLASTHGKVDFAKWRDSVKASAADERIPISDQTLQTIWDSAKFKREFMAPLSVAQSPPQVGADAAKSINDQSTVTEANKLTDDFTPGAFRQWANRTFLKDGVLGFDIIDYTDRAVNMVRDLADNQLYTLPRMGDIAKYRPRMVEGATRYITSRGLAYITSRQHFDGIKDILTVKNERGKVDAKATQAQVDTLARLLIDDRARAMEARGQKSSARRAEIETKLAELKVQEDATAVALKKSRRMNNLRFVEELEKDARKQARERSKLVDEAAELPPTDAGRYPKMSDAERQQALANPKMQAALAHYIDKVMPEIAVLSKDVGITGDLTGPLGTYVRMKWELDPAKLPEGGADVISYGLTSPTPGSASPYNVRPRKSVSRNRATGKAPDTMYLESDLFNMLNNTFTDRLSVKAMQDLRTLVEEHSLGTNDTLKPHEIPRYVKKGNRLEPVVTMTLERAGGFTDTKYYVPESVRTAYDIATSPFQDKMVKALDSARSAFTVPLLIVPAEAVIHGLNVAHAVSTTEFASRNNKTARFTEAMSGVPGKIIKAALRARSLKGEKLAELVKKGAENGWLRLSGMEHTTEQRSLMMAMAHKVKPLRVIKDFVFGYPGSNKGFKGLETRFRIVIYEAIREAHPELSERAAGQAVNDAMGTYVGKLEPGATRTLGTLYPFARARVALTKNGLRAMTSRDAAGAFNPMIGMAQAATIAATIITVAALDDKKRFPWQIPGAKVGDVRFQYGDKVVNIPFSLLNNSLYRGMAATGIRNGVNSYLKGERTLDGLSTTVGEGITNYLASFSGPLVAAGMTATTGKVPYFVGGELMDVAKPSMTGGKVQQRLGAAVKQTIPLISKGFEYADPSGKEVRPSGKFTDALYTAAELFGVAPKLEMADTAELRAASSIQRTAQVEWADVAIAISNEAQRLAPDERAAYIQQEIASNRVSNVIIPDKGKLKPAKAAALELAMKLAYSAQGRLSKSAALQQVNQPNDMWNEIDQELAGGAANEEVGVGQQ